MLVQGSKAGDEAGNLYTWMLASELVTIIKHRSFLLCVLIFVLIIRSE